MFDATKKFLRQYDPTPDPVKDAMKTVTKGTTTAESKYATSTSEDKAVDYALGLYKQQHKDNGTKNPYPWL